MKTVVRWFGIMLLCVASATVAGGAGLAPLVGADWLLAQGDRDELVILDIQERGEFAQHHIAGAVNFPFSQWRTGAKSQPPVAIPPLAKLAGRLGRLGIGRGTPVIIVSMGAGASDMAGAARVYWTLAVLGHEQMAILDGGLLSYVNEFRGTYVSGKAMSRRPVTYTPRPNPSLLATADQIRKRPQLPLLDARSVKEYLGLSGGARGRSGTIPGARNLPFDWLVNDKGKIRKRPAVDKLFAFVGLPRGGAVHFCQTGHRSAMTWFADYALLGNHDARLYDGSMLEWAADPSLPLERKLDL